MVFSVATGVWVRARAVLVTSAVTTEVGEAVTVVTAVATSPGSAPVLGILLE